MQPHWLSSPMLPHCSAAAAPLFTMDFPWNHNFKNPNNVTDVNNITYCSFTPILLGYPQSQGYRSVVGSAGGGQGSDVDP